MNTDPAKSNFIHVNELLEPNYISNPIIFRDSLVDLKRYDEEPSCDIQSNKTTFNVLAPYLEVIYRDQKKILSESAKNLEFSTKTKEAKLLLCKDKIKDQSSNRHANECGILEKYEMIVSLHETADILQILLKANTVITYLVDPAKNELYQSSRHLISSIDLLTWKIEPASTMAVYAAHTKQYVISNNVQTDTRFPLGLGFPNTLMKFGLCVPIKTDDNRVVAVYELTRDAFSSEFSSRDVQVMLTVVGWMGFAIKYNNLCTDLMHRLQLRDYLLQLTDHYHGGHATLYETLSAIVTFARQTVSAELCNFYLVEKGNDDTLIVEEYNQDNENSLFKRKKKKNVVQDGSYLSNVVFGKQVVNKHETQVEINLSADAIHVRSILCIPIICKCDEVIGIIQLANKKMATKFSLHDEDILKMFADWFAINLNSNKLQESQKRSLLLNNINREMLLYHMTSCTHDRKSVIKPVENLPSDFYTITWYPPMDCKALLPQFAVQMFHDVLGDSFMQSNNVKEFISTVRSCYRPNHYHNFTHAVNATHKMAIILKHCSGMFTSLERQSMMLAILCHDVDHQGYSNTFLELTDHYLSKLYDSCPTENHAFAVTKVLIEKHGMFRNHCVNTYNNLLSEIYELIKATDLSCYFQNKTRLLQLAHEKLINFNESDHKRIIKNLIIISCDLSDQITPFPDCKKITEDFFEEWFFQGDLLKRHDLIPMPLMDRLQKDMIPENQIQFLTVIVLPMLETLSHIFEITSPLVFNCKEVIKYWKMLVEVKNEETWKPDESIVKPTVISL